MLGLEYRKAITDSADIDYSVGRDLQIASTSLLLN